MVENSWNLEKVKRFLENFVEDKSNYYMIVVNKVTKQEGCATITKDKKIAVFEGKADGSEDKIYNQKEFKEKYRIDSISKFNSKITVKDIEMDLFSLDTEYREALANSLVELKYISDTPLNLEYGTEKQQEELEKFWKKSLKPIQIKIIINGIINEMKGDFQYGAFSRIASEYISTVENMRKSEDNEVKRALKNVLKKRETREIKIETVERFNKNKKGREAR